jgi:hypothetical protein
LQERSHDMSCAKEADRMKRQGRAAALRKARDLRHWKVMSMRGCLLLEGQVWAVAAKAVASSEERGLKRLRERGREDHVSAVSSSQA